ncbi:MAG: 16S rRNA (cytidine(1402)-2'-O)-methyltransferase [Erysipelotrichaceae bacterium]|nr:16S rRNA (cytidine(1402)-2'-O)-methyltransferase [Erysipelotrichaceae bacterium]
MVNKPTLYLVATPIGNLNEITPRALKVLSEVEVIACEDTRNTLKLLSHFAIHKRLIAYHNFNEEDSTKGIMEMLESGKDVALVSDAGYPLISDPGYLLCEKVIAQGFNIVTISGPNAGINALVASGLDTNHYLFYGFLNAKPAAAEKELLKLKDFPYTMIFYEAPHRINRTVKLALATLGDRKAVIARELTKIHEEYLRGRLSELAEHDNLKGEIVLLIEGCPRDTKKVSFDDVLPEAIELIDNGLKAKMAIKQVANKYQLSANELYDYYLKTK